VNRFLLVALAGVLATAGASAGTIGPSCGSCFGGTYSLNGYLVSSNGSVDVWQYTYTLMTQGVTGSGISYVGSLAAKVTTDLISVVTVGSPDFTGWSNPALNTNVNNSGCDGSGNGWICIAWQPLGAQVLTGASAASSYSWTFQATMKTGTNLADASIQANFDPANGKILSETVHVPEGGAAIELAAMLSGLGLLRFVQARSRRRMTFRASQ
jgi:hypothetical protein